MNESVSSYFKSIAVAVVTIAALVGCGQNPLNRESDPLKDYKTLKKDLPKDQVHVPGGLNCPAPYSSLTITNEKGEAADDALVFTAGTKTTYQIHLESETRTSFQLVLTKQLAGMSFDGSTVCNVQLKPNAEGVKEGVCELSYQPSAKANKSLTNFLLHAEVGKKDCDDRDERKSFAVRIEGQSGSGSAGAPSLQKIDGLSTTKFYAKADKVSFTVVTADPNIQDSETAVAPQFEFVDLNPGNKTPFVNAKDAIICGAPAKKGKQTFQFACNIDFAKISGIPAGKFARATFDIYAQSVRSDSQSGRFGVNLTIKGEETP